MHLAIPLQSVELQLLTSGFQIIKKGAVSVNSLSVVGKAGFHRSSPADLIFYLICRNWVTQPLVPPWRLFKWIFSLVFHGACDRIMLLDMGVELAGWINSVCYMREGKLKHVVPTFCLRRNCKVTCWWVGVEGDWWVGRSMFYGTGKWGLEWLHWPVGEGTGWENVKR